MLLLKLPGVSKKVDLPSTAHIYLLQHYECIADFSTGSSGHSGP